MKLQEKMRQMAEELWVEANNLDKLNQVVNQAGCDVAKDEANITNVYKDFNPQKVETRDYESYVTSTDIDSKAARLFCQFNVKEFKLRKRVEASESMLERVKKAQTFDREWLGDIEKRVTKMAPEVQAVTEAVRASLTPAETAWEQDRKFNSLEQNVKSCMTMFADLEKKLGILAGQTPARAELVCTDQAAANLTKRVKALESRLAKDWDKKRR